MLTEYQKSIFQTLIHSSDLSDEAAGALLAVYRLYERTEIERQKLTRQLDKEEYTSRLAQSDRDNRRRRMDLARAILDETQVHDLDKVAEIVWPAEESEYAPVMQPVAPYPPMTDFNGMSVPTGARCESDAISYTQDGHPLYRRGSQVQSVPFDVSANSFALQRGDFPDISKPSILNTGDHQKQPNESDPRCSRWYGVDGFDELRCIKNEGHGGECTIDVPRIDD